MEMRRIFLLILLLSTRLSEARAPITWVSDIDDTIKITHVRSATGRLLRTTFKVRSFTGMRELYQHLVQPDKGDQIVYLTGAPQILSPLVKDFLEDHHFPEGKVILRPNRDSRTLEDYKFESIVKLMNQTESDFILIGDDTQSDPQAYQRAFEFDPGRVLGVYIHRIIGSRLNSGWYGFLTAFDVARIEYLMGRLPATDALEVGQLILDEKKFQKVIPGFAYCPSRKINELFNQEIRMMNEAILRRIERVCIKEP
jgi:phosphatidate phosphatase APP1